MLGNIAASLRTGDRLLGGLATALLLLALGLSTTAWAMPLEMLALPSATDDEDTLAFSPPSDQATAGNSITSILPSLMPLYAGTDLGNYASGVIGGRSAEDEQWSASNSQWLRAMLPTILQTRRKSAEAEVQLHDRQLLREQRLRVAPRAGRPTVVDENAEEGPQLGIRVTDILLRYSRGAISTITPHLTSGETRDANPFNAESGEGGLGTTLLFAEVDIATAERLDRTVAEHEQLITSTVETSEVVARQLAQLDTKFKDLVGSGSLGGGIHEKGSMRNLIGTDRSGGGLIRERNGGAGVVRKDIKLTSLLVDLSLSVATSPITYLVAIPLLFGWMLVRVARARNA